MDCAFDWNLADHLSYNTHTIYIKFYVGAKTEF